jgi:hypothetical protein
MVFDIEAKYKESTKSFNSDSNTYQIPKFFLLIFSKWNRAKIVDWIWSIKVYLKKAKIGWRTLGNTHFDNLIGFGDRIELELELRNTFLIFEINIKII